MEVFSHLNAQDLINVAMVCKEFSKIAREPLLWKNLLSKREGSIQKYEQFLIRQKKRMDDTKRDNFWERCYRLTQQWNTKIGKFENRDPRSGGSSRRPEGGWMRRCTVMRPCQGQFLLDKKIADKRLGTGAACGTRCSGSGGSARGSTRAL